MVMELSMGLSGRRTEKTEWGKGKRW